MEKVRDIVGLCMNPPDNAVFLCVDLSVPGLVGEREPTPAIPVKRAWVEALVGRQVRIASVKAEEVTRFSLRPA